MYFNGKGECRSYYTVVGVKREIAFAVTDRPN